MDNTLSPSARILQLQREHRALDEKIRAMIETPGQNQLLVQKLKKEKLRLKDVIERLKDDLIPDLDA